MMSIVTIFIQNHVLTIFTELHCNFRLTLHLQVQENIFRVD